jgi:flagellar basal body rod protein FlgF
MQPSMDQQQTIANSMAAYSMAGFNPQMMAMMAQMGQLPPQMMQMMMAQMAPQAPPIQMAPPANAAYVRAL